tara:strand:- start:948 stop:2651 length:1704 start_codon:yes stop_codon:yes gene_type:complete
MRGFEESKRFKKRSSIKGQYSEESNNFELYKKALTFQKEGILNKAAEIYNILIKNYYRNENIFINYAEVCQKLNNPNNAILLLKEAIKMNPRNSVSFFKMGYILNNKGNFYEAYPFAKKAIELNPNLWQGYHNLIKILRNLNRPKDAKDYAKSAKKLFSNNHLFLSLLGDINSDLGNFKEAIKCYKNAIELSPKDEITLYTFANFSIGIGNKKESINLFNKILKNNPLHSLSLYSLSTILDTEEDQVTKNKITKLRLDDFKSNYDRYTILFSKSHIFHKIKDFDKSAKFLKKANNLKLKVKPSNIETVIKTSKKIQEETSKDSSFNISNFQNLRDIFIVGLPRSGSTLVESIIGINKDVQNLGENSIFLNAYMESKRSNFADIDKIYLKYVKNYSSKKFTTNKMLSNYMYIPYIVSKLNHSKVIYTFRNPLDNILSMYRAKFNGGGNEYSSSLTDSAKYYIHQFNLMSFYRNKYKKHIYFLNYDKLVNHTELEIKKLINWLGFNWDKSYLQPNKNKQGFFTASNVQVRSPINNKSVGGWEKYSNIMEEPIKIFRINNFSLDSFKRFT